MNSLYLEKQIEKLLKAVPLQETLQKPYHQKVHNFNVLKEFFGSGNIPEEYLKSFLQNPEKNYILENLQTHDWKKLGNKIKNIFPNNFKKIEPFYPSSTDIKKLCAVRFKGTKEYPLNSFMKDIEKNLEFKHILELFNYSVSNIVKEIGTVVIEPIYSESANDTVYNICHGVGYHITAKKNAEIIERTGLRARTGDPEDIKRHGGKNYRNFPKRVYFFIF